MTTTIAVIVGSLRKESYNRKLAQAVARLAPPDFTFKILDISDIPLYNQDHDADPAPSVKRLKEEVAAAQGVLFVTPEYNRSIPGVLKNILDHGSRPYGKSVWAKKPAGILGATPGATGTAMAQQHLRNIISALDMPTLEQPEAYITITDTFFDATGGIGEHSKAFLQKWMDSFVAWVNDCR
jgi:chromate reductase